MWPRRSGISGRVLASLGGPEGVGDLRAGPQPRAPCFLSRRDRVDGAGAEEDVARGRGGGHADRVAVVGELLRLSIGPLADLPLSLLVGARLRLPEAGQHDLVEGLALRVREGPAAEPPVVGGEVAGGDGEPLPGDDEDQDAVLGEEAGAVGEEAVLDPLLVVRVPVVGRVEEQHAEGPVGDGGLEEVGGERVVEPLPCLLRAVAVQLDAEGLDGDGVGAPQPLGELGEGFPRPAAGVEEAEGLLPAAAAPPRVAGGRVEQRRDQVDDLGRRGVEAPLGLCGESHVDSPFGSLVFWSMPTTSPTARVRW